MCDLSLEFQLYCKVFAYNIQKISILLDTLQIKFQLLSLLKYYQGDSPQFH
jgi:hypothetical protein